jgi:hypothetical protein
MTCLPRYEELPIRVDAPAGASWGVWGDDDRLGCLNLIDQAATMRGINCVRRGERFCLDLEHDQPSPGLFGRGDHAHDVRWLPGKIGHDESVSDFNTQRSSQWDGFRHMRWPPAGFYNGLPDEAHGVEHWAQHGIATRGIVLDIARHRDRQGRPLRHGEPDMIDAAELASVLRATGIDPEPGDVLMIRTGWVEWYAGLPLEERARVAEGGAYSGLRAGRETAAFLWDNHFAAVVADNPALEAFPAGCAVPPTENLIEWAKNSVKAVEVFLHYGLLALLGLPIGELWSLKALADDCAREQSWDCFLISAPLRIPQGVASTANALALR